MEEYDIGYPHSKQKRILPHNFRTIHNRMAAFKLDATYYDGQRENGYGGFQYDGRWQEIIPSIAKRYGLTADSRVLEVGCKKGFFLHDMQACIPGITVAGVENHPYPLKQAMPSVKPFMQQADYEKLPYPDNHFDFVLGFASIYMLHLGGVVQALREIQRVCRGGSYVTLGAYHSQEGKELFLDWTLIGTTVLHVDEWQAVFKEADYQGDYFFTTAESLYLHRA
ncbi:MAG: class I SAM-dependent methyltransferase [Magnetococcales bacterium]|nr:class I SAM-dependent methyltransferase [Magnetococcales bacterium]